MNMAELDTFLTERPYILWARDDEGNFYFRHEHYDGENEKVRIEMSALEKLSSAELEKVLVDGRNVEHITRITGYFSKVSGWNNGKRGELADRHRVTIQ